MFGTNTSFDTLAVARNQTVAQFGEDRAFDAIEMAMAAHNEQVTEMLGDLVETTQDNMRSFGGPASMQMEELDEYGTPESQKVFPDLLDVGFPCRKYGAALQWTRQYLRNATPEELAKDVSAMMTADIRMFKRDLSRALFYPTNYSFRDRLGRQKLTLPVKALVNQDGGVIPLGPDGVEFDGSSHNHYMGTSSFVAGDLTSGVSNVNEHFQNGEILIYINAAQETAVRGFSAGGFTPALPGSIVAATTTTQVRGALDVYRTNNRWIGDFNGVQVWVKPWIPSGYVLFLHVGTGDKVLCKRTMTDTSGNLELIFDIEQYPLRAKSYEREFGFGVWNRVAAAVLDTAHSSYNSPTINA